jgi:guanyl-specific ribonuclease Sa
VEPQEEVGLGGASQGANLNNTGWTPGLALQLADAYLARLEDASRPVPRQTLDAYNVIAEVEMTTALGNRQTYLFGYNEWNILNGFVARFGATIVQQVPSWMSHDPYHLGQLPAYQPASQPIQSVAATAIPVPVLPLLPFPLTCLVPSLLRTLLSASTSDRENDNKPDCTKLAGGRAPNIPQIPSSLLYSCVPEAKRTVELIRHNGEPAWIAPGHDNTEYKNNFNGPNALLPIRPNEYYREYTVITPVTPGIRGRGLRRIVTGGRTNRSPGAYEIMYYSDAHYGDLDGTGFVEVLRPH